jgi:hypothetical protein
VTFIRALKPATTVETITHEAAKPLSKAAQARYDAADSSERKI